MEVEEGRDTFRIWSQKAILSDPQEATPGGIIEKVKCGLWQADVLSYPSARRGAPMEEFLVLGCVSAVPDTAMVVDWEELAQDLDVSSGCIMFCDAAELKKRGDHAEWFAAFKDDLTSAGDAMVRAFDAGAYTKHDQGTAKCWVSHDDQNRVVAIKIALQLLQGRKLKLS